MYLRFVRLRYILIFLFCFPVFCFAQDISGRWTGTLSQSGADFGMGINIVGFNNGVLNGTSRFSGSGSDFVEMRFAGSYNNSIAVIAEQEVEKIPSGLVCALKTLTGTIRIDTAAQLMIMEGKWVATKEYRDSKYFDIPSSGGTFKISRKVVVQQVTKAKVLNRPLDNYYTKQNIPLAKVVKLPELREQDIVFEHRVWRDIDLREKMNWAMSSPKSRLIDILTDAVDRGEITAFDPVSSKDDPDGDQFSTPLTPEKAHNMLADSALVNSFDKNGDKIGSKMVAGDFNPDSVVRFRLKEDFIFDQQRSVTEYRIIGIAPLIRKKVEGAGPLDYQPAYWLYFPEVRKVLVKKPVVNSHNDAMNLSYDDLFMKRLFTGYIVKESNDRDERIKDQFTGIDRLYESERIKKSLLDWELNLWQY